MTHAPGRASEHKALGKVASKLKSIKATILVELKEAGEHGLTADEVNDKHGWLIVTTRRRFTDLHVEDRKIKKHPKNLTRPNSDGTHTDVWVLGTDPNAKRSRVTKAEFNKLLEENAALQEENAALSRLVRRLQRKIKQG